MYVRARVCVRVRHGFVIGHQTKAARTGREGEGERGVEVNLKYTVVYRES